MRYLIETHPDYAMQIGAEIARWQKAGKLQIIEHGDPIEQVKTELIKIKRAFETLEKVGISRDVMITYVKTKSGLGKATVEQVLDKQDEFFKKLGVK
jgi:hypothetical protein